MRKKSDINRALSVTVLLYSRQLCRVYNFFLFLLPLFFFLSSPSLHAVNRSYIISSSSGFHRNHSPGALQRKVLYNQHFLSVGLLRKSDLKRNQLLQKKRRLWGDKKLLPLLPPLPSMPTARPLKLELFVNLKAKRRQKTLPPPLIRIQKPHDTQKM